MKLKIINPDSGFSREALDKKIEILRRAARPDTEISMDCPQGANVCIDSFVDIAVDTMEIVTMARRAEQEGYDAVGLYCLGDPGIDACREALRIPVIGGGQSSLQIACGLGYKFSLLVTSKRRIPQKEEFVRGSGVDPSRLASVRSAEIDFRHAFSNFDHTVKALADTGRLCMEQDGAQVLILGCLSFTGMGEAIGKMLGIPVIDPGLTLVSMAELLHAQGLCHSKLSYPIPPPLERYWQGGTLPPIR